ncbi:MAG: rhodanese-like domain-containing protein, partial [Eubacterium callanderi]
MWKKGIIILMLLVLAATAYTGCTAKPTKGSSQSKQEGDKNMVKAEYHKISQYEAKKRMDEQE